MANFMFKKYAGKSWPIILIVYLQHMHVEIETYNKIIEKCATPYLSHGPLHDLFQGRGFLI